jgi:hypothetical protein
MRVIDTSGPDGNAFVLMGYAKRFGRQLGWSREEIDTLIKEMMSGDYDNLTATFEEAFEGIVELV